MSKGKASKSKHGKRLSPEVQEKLRHDITAGIATGDLMKKYQISGMTVRRMKVLMEKEKKQKPMSVLDMKKALDLSKAQSLLVWTMEQMETAMRRIDEDREKYTPKTQADTAVHCGRLILEIHNTLLLSETPDIPGDYNADDVNLNELLMNMLTDKQKEELFEKYTGQSLATLATGKSGTKPEPK